MDSEQPSEEFLGKFTKFYQTFANTNEIFLKQVVENSGHCATCTLRKLIDQSFSWKDVLRDVEIVRNENYTFESSILEILILSYHYRFAYLQPIQTIRYSSTLYNSFHLNPEYVKTPPIQSLIVFQTMIRLLFVEIFEKFLDFVLENMYNVNPRDTQVYEMMNLFLEPLLIYCYRKQHMYDEKKQEGTILIQLNEFGIGKLYRETPMEFSYRM
jgi:hypothetical protein